MVLLNRAGYEEENITRLFYPAAKRTEEIPAAGDFLLVQRDRHSLLAMARVAGQLFWKAAAVEPGQSEAQLEYALCKMLYAMLCEKTGYRPPWGMLTGVRPVRLIHDLRAEGQSEIQIRDQFCIHYDCLPQKYALANYIADLQTPWLRNATAKDCSVYIHIPFCPTRCAYCSFVSSAVEKPAMRALREPYLTALCEEISAIGEIVNACGLRVHTLYIGGGTPTSLEAEQLARLLRHLESTFAVSDLEEYSVEAGRPDCTDAEKLRLLKQYGVTRISINPQTFSDEILLAIGRKHTARDVIECYQAARAAGHLCINMDLIAGLPGDTTAGFSKSLETAIKLAPENITVHTLTKKRASDLVVEHRSAAYGAVNEMVEQEMALLPRAGYRPYYLYRQKGALQNLENVGWSKPGFEGAYNIYMMEEIHTIFAAGAGACSKFVLGGKRRGHIQRFYNCKYPREYLAQFATVLRKKQEMRSFYVQG